MIVCENCRDWTYKKLGAKAFYLSVEENILTAQCTTCKHKTTFHLSASTARKGE